MMRNALCEISTILVSHESCWLVACTRFLSHSCVGMKEGKKETKRMPSFSFRFHVHYDHPSRRAI